MPKSRYPPPPRRRGLLLRTRGSGWRTWGVRRRCRGCANETRWLRPLWNPMGRLPGCEPTCWPSWIPMSAFPASPSGANSITIFGATKTTHGGSGAEPPWMNTARLSRNGRSCLISTLWENLKKKTGSGAGRTCCVRPTTARCSACRAAGRMRRLSASSI